MTWNILSKKEVYKNPYRTLEEWMIKNPRGEQIPAFINIVQDVVMVFGITDDGRLLLLKQFFISSQEHQYTLVAGLVEKGANIDDEAKRELMEEAGCVAREVRCLGSSLRGKWDTGMVHFYLALGVEQTESQALESLEDITVQFVPRKECEAMLAQGKIHDVFSVAAAYRALEYLRFST